MSMSVIIVFCFFFLMIRCTPKSTRPDTLFPDPTLFLSAEVIKIEPPDGDPTRVLGPGRNPVMSAVFLGSNRNERCLALDLKKPAAKEALWRLIDRKSTRLNSSH